MDDFMVKPLSPDALRGMLARWAGAFSLRTTPFEETKKAPNQRFGA
jgi:hypothetical protein